MQTELEMLRLQVENLRLQNQLLQESLKESQAEIKRQAERIDYLIRQLLGKKSEKLDPNQLMLLLGVDEMPPEEPPEDDPPPSGTPRPRRKRRQIKDRLPEHLPVRTTIIDPPEVLAHPDEYRCIGEETHTELGMTPPVYFQRKTVRRKYVKKSDRAAPPIIVPAVPRLIDNSFASVELIIDIILKKYVYHLPLYRQEQILLRQYGIELSRKTMSGWMWRIGDWLNPIYREMKEELRASGYLQADETCVRYLAPGTGTSHQGYLWVYHSPGRSVVFEWHRGRGQECLESMLSDYRGDLQCDGYQAYRSFNLSHAQQGRYQLFACWAHARRRFFEAKDDSSLPAQVLLALKALYRIETELRESGATDIARLARRQQDSKPLLADIKSMLHSELGNHRPQTLTGKAVSYTLNLWEELERYADTGHVEIDNNLVENTIRPTAIGKRNWLFFGAPDSGQQSAVIYSILETCRKLGIDQQEYLCDVLTRLPEITYKEARQLTPAKWMTARAKASA